MFPNLPLHAFSFLKGRKSSHCENEPLPRSSLLPSGTLDKVGRNRLLGQESMISIPFLWQRPTLPFWVLPLSAYRYSQFPSKDTRNSTGEQAVQSSMVVLMYLSGLLQQQLMQGCHHCYPIREPLTKTEKQK